VTIPVPLANRFIPMYVCMYVCIYVRMYACICVCVQFLDRDMLPDEAGGFIIAYTLTSVTGPARFGLDVIAMPWLARRLKASPRLAAWIPGLPQSAIHSAAAAADGIVVQPVDAAKQPVDKSITSAPSSVTSPSSSSSSSTDADTDRETIKSTSPPPVENNNNK
jgi:hypothetical protein